MSSLEQALALIAAANAQSISVAVHDSHSGERVELRARESMHAASTMKLAVLLRKEGRGSEAGPGGVANRLAVA